MKADRIIDVFESATPPRAGLDLGVLNQHLEFVAHRTLLRLRRQLIHLGGVRPVTYNALVLIGANPGMTQSEFADALVLDKGTAAHLMRELERQGWIERRHCSANRRWKGVYLSPGGVQELERLQRKVQPIAQRIQSLYTPSEYRQLLELLNRAVATLDD